MKELAAVLLKKISQKIQQIKGKNRLFLTRLFWGIMTGSLCTFFITGSPLLSSMERSMLEWRYKISESFLSSQKTISKDIVLVEFDDMSQFELGIARFNDLHSQRILAETLENIEKSGPVLVVLDLDLRGTVCPALLKVLRYYRNVVLGLFGALDGSTDLPSSDYLVHASAFGYNELAHEENGSVLQLPITYREVSSDLGVNSEKEPLAPVPSLMEAVIDLNRHIRGVGVDTQFFVNRSKQPLYLSYKRFSYSSISLVDVLKGRFRPGFFHNRIVLIGCTFTPKNNGTNKLTEREKPLPDLLYHAQAISTLLNNEQLSTFSPQLAKLFIFVLGAIFGGLASILRFAIRLPIFCLSAVLTLLIGQFCFQSLHLIIPIVPLLAVIFLCLCSGTFIYLDTDLRERNSELAQARKSMQVRAEEERQRIAEDLHDETLPALSAVARMADKLNQQLGNNPIPVEMRERLDFSVTEMRRVINDLHPSVLETMGFRPALENLLVNLVRDGGIETYSCESGNLEDEDLPKFTRLQLYRIVQEAINNIHKHANAKHVDLNISKNNGTIVISVADNGSGMPRNLLAGAMQGESHGIVNIKQRAQLIGARVEWKKPANYISGTEMHIELSTDNRKETEGAIE